ncbi:MAG: ribonuclease H-like domain-containing protein [Clostridium sp.]|nr:ribonuclease H-like domain-containing protein [Clostridium sp.]
MITIKHPVDLPDTYPLERIGALKDLLFFDIETTGFSGDTSQLYLIGCTYHDGFGWKLIQWFADTKDSEGQLLEAFFTFMERFKVLVHFNGDGFDIPYLLKCCKRLGLNYDFDSIASLDIYKKIKPYRTLLGLENMKQKSIESFLGVNREDRYSGGQLIDVYREYLVTHESFLYDLLILHNEDDLKGMPSILPVLNYPDLMESPFALADQQLCSYDDVLGNNRPFLNLTFKNSYAVPVPLEYDGPPVSLELHQDTLTCNIALFEGELKYFYPNYKDYYYLPMEDTAVHKSIGEYVEKSARTKATAKTCYTKKSGLFLPQFEPLWTPALQPDYKAPLTYTEYSPELLSDSRCADSYARQVLSYVSRKKK